MDASTLHQCPRRSGSFPTASASAHRVEIRQGAECDGIRRAEPEETGAVPPGGKCHIKENRREKIHPIIAKSVCFEPLGRKCRSSRATPGSPRGFGTVQETRKRYDM